jgi:hypothetical protein
MVEHVSITDPQIHKTKGVAAASDGKVHAALTGDGTWVEPYTLKSVRRTIIMQASHTTDQTITSDNVAQNILFGAAQDVTDIGLASTGVVTVKQAGFYELTFTVGCGRSSGSNSSIIHARILINGAQVGNTLSIRLSGSNSIIPIHSTFSRLLNMDDTIKVEIMRDSVGDSTGGLFEITPTNTAFSKAPSASLRVVKLEGVV